MSDVKEEKPKLSQEQLMELGLRSKFRGGLHAMAKEMQGMSNRGIKRAITAALCLPVEDGRLFKFQTEKEARLAGILAQVLDVRTVLQSIDYNKETENGKMDEPGHSETENENRLGGQLGAGELPGSSPISEDSSR